MAIQAPGHVNDMLFVLVGEKLIEANEDLAHGSHKPFRQMGRELRELSELTEESIVRARNALPPRVGDDYARAMSPFVGEDGHLKQFAGQLDVIADGRIKTSYQAMEAKWQILAEVIRLMMELLAVFALSVFSAGAAAGRAAVARARSRVVVLTVMDRLFKSMHALPVLSEAFEEAFQSFAVRLGMIAFTSGEFSPKGFDWTQIAQDAATGAFMGAFFPVIAKGSQGTFAGIRSGLGRGGVAKDVGGDVSSKVGAAVDRVGVNRVPGGKGGAGDVVVAGRGYQRPGVVSGFLAEGGSESLAEVLSGGLFHGNWSSSAATFFGAGISGQVTQKLHSGAVASGTWINTTFSVQSPPGADGVADPGPAATVSSSVPRSTVSTVGGVPDTRTEQAGSTVGAGDAGVVQAPTVGAASVPAPATGLDSPAPSLPVQTTVSDLTISHGGRGGQDLAAAVGTVGEQARTVEAATAAPSTPSRIAFADPVDQGVAVPADVVADRSAAVSAQAPGQVVGQVPDVAGTANQPSVFPGRGLVEGQFSAAAVPRSDAVVPGFTAAVPDSVSGPVWAVSGDPVSGGGGVETGVKAGAQQSVGPAWRVSESVGAVPFQGVAAPPAVTSQTVTPAAMPGRSVYQADGASGQSADQASASGRTASQPSASPGRISTVSGGTTTHDAHDAHDAHEPHDEQDAQEEARRPGRFGTVSASSAGDGPMDTAVQGRNGVDAVWSTDSASAPAGAVGESVVSGVTGGLGVGAEQVLLGLGQADSDRWIPYGRVRSGVKVRYLLDRLGVGPGDGSVADLLGVGVGEVEGYRRGVRVPSAGVGVRIDVVWGLLREGRTGVTSADVDDVVEAGGAVSGPGAGVGVSGRVGGMSEVAPAVDYLAEGLDADELRFVSEPLASDSAGESVVEPVGSDEVVSGLDADEWAGVWSALASDSDSESVVEPVTWDEVGADLGLDPDELEFVSEAVGEDPDVESGVELSGGEVAGGLEEALSSGDASVVGASFVDEGGSGGGFLAGGGRGRADADVVAARGAKRRRLDGGGRPVVEVAAAGQAGGGVAAGAGAAQDGGPARSLLQLKLERVRDALGSVDGVDPVERLAGVVQIPADRVRGMVGGSVEQTSVTGEHRERIDAAFGLLNEGAALTAEAVDERVRARWTPLQATMVYLMEQAGVPGRTAEGVRLSDLLQGRRAAVYEFRWGTITPTMKVGDRINALKRLFEAGEDGLTPARVDAEVTRYRDEQEVDFAGKLAYLRGKLGGTRALVGAIKASDATLNISDKSVPSYVDPDYDANPPMDVSERVDELYALYRELDDVAEMAGLPTGGTLSPVQVKTGCLRESLGEGELPRLLKVSPQEVSSILSGRVKTPDTKVIECVDAAYGLLEEGVAVTTEAVDERVRARWTPIQKTMVSLLDGVGGARPLSDLLGVDISSVRYMRAGFQQPHKKIGDRIRALERLLSARAGGPLPTRADVDAAVAAAPAYDLTARVRYLSQVTGNINAVVRELNVGRAVGEPKVAWSTLKSYLQGGNVDPNAEFADRIDRACHDFWRLGFRPVDAELAGVLRGEVAAAMAARSVSGFVGGGDGTLARLAGGGRLAGERTQVGYAWRWFRDGAGQEVVRLTRRVYVAGAVVERVEAMRGRVSGVLEGLNGQGHRLPEGAGAASGSRLELGVEFVGSPEEADTVVELREGLPGGETGTMRQDVWFTGVDATAYAHELVHGFGVRDDVADPQVLLTPGGRGEQATAQGASSLMDTHVHGAGQSFVLTSDHLRQIAEGLAPYFHAGAGAGGSRGQVVRGAVGERPGYGGGMRDVAPAVDYRTQGTDADREHAEAVADREESSSSDGAEGVREGETAAVAQPRAAAGSVVGNRTVHEMVHERDRDFLVLVEDERLWRFDEAPPEEVFQNGVRAADPDSATPLWFWAMTTTEPAQFVATTRNFDLWFRNKRYRYEIHSSRNSERSGINLDLTILKQKASSHHHLPSTWRNTYDESEITFTGAIDPQAFMSVYDSRENRTGTWNPDTREVDWRPGQLQSRDNPDRRVEPGAADGQPGQVPVVVDAAPTAQDPGALDDVGADVSGLSSGELDGLDSLFGPDEAGADVSGLSSGELDGLDSLFGPDEAGADVSGLSSGELDGLDSLFGPDEAGADVSGLSSGELDGLDSLFGPDEAGADVSDLSSLELDGLDGLIGLEGVNLEVSDLSSGESWLSSTEVDSMWDGYSESGEGEIPSSDDVRQVSGLEPGPGEDLGASDSSLSDESDAGEREGTDSALRDGRALPGFGRGRMPVGDSVVDPASGTSRWNGSDDGADADVSDLSSDESDFWSDEESPSGDPYEADQPDTALHGRTIATGRGQSPVHAGESGAESDASRAPSAEHVSPTLGSAVASSDTASDGPAGPGEADERSSGQPEGQGHAATEGNEDGAEAALEAGKQRNTSARIESELDTHRPTRIDRSMAPPFPQEGPVPFSDGSRLLEYLTAGYGSGRTEGRSYGFSQVTLRGADRVVREVGDRLGAARGGTGATPGLEEALEDLRRALGATPQVFHGDGYESPAFGHGLGHVLRVTTRPYGAWERFADTQGEPTVLQVEQASRVTTGATKGVSSGTQLSVGVSLWPGAAALSGRVGASAGVTRAQQYAMRDRSTTRLEQYSTDGSHLHLDDVWYEVSVSGPPRPESAAGGRNRSVADGDTFGFAVRHGLTVRLPDSFTTPGEPGRVPSRIELGPQSDYRLVHTEGYGPVKRLRELVLEQLAANGAPDKAAREQIAAFFSSENFHRLADRLARGPVATGLLSADDGSPLGTIIVERVVPGEALLLTESSAVEFRNTIQHTVTNERVASRTSSRDFGVGVGRYFEVDSPAWGPIVAGIGGGLSRSTTEDTVFGGSGSRKTMGRVKEKPTALFWVSKTVTVRWTGAPEPLSVETWSLDRMTHTEARRLAGWDDGTTLRARNENAPFAPLYLTPDRPAMLGMSRAESFTYADGDLTRGPDGRHGLLDTFTDAVLQAAAVRHPGLFVLLGESGTPSSPAWRDAQHYNLALQNTLTVMNVLSHHSVAGSLEALTRTGITIDLTARPSGLHRPHLSLHISGELTGRRYEGTQNDFTVRAAAPGTIRLDGSHGATRAIGAGIDASARGAFTKTSRHAVTVSAGPRWERAEGRGGDHGSTVSYEDLAAGSKSSHLFGYDLELTARIDGFSRYRSGARAVSLGVLGMPAFLRDEGDAALVSIRGRVLLSVPDEHTPATDPHADGAGSPAPVVEPLDTAEARALVTGEPPAADNLSTASESRGQSVSGNEGLWQDVFGSHPYQTLSVGAHPELNRAAEELMAELSSDSWRFARTGALPHDALMRQFQPQFLTAGFDQASASAGSRLLLRTQGGLRGQDATVVHRVRVVDPVVVSKPVTIATEQSISMDLQAGGAAGTTRSSAWSLGVTGASTLTRDNGTVLSTAYGLSYSRGSSLTTATAVTRTVTFEVGQGDGGHHVLIAGGTRRELAGSLRPAGALGSLLGPWRQNGFAGRRLTVAQDWLGHVPEKAAHELGLIQDGLGQVPRFTAKPWTLPKWLHDHPFGSFAANALDTGNVLTAFTRELRSQGVTLDQTGLERLRDLVSPRALRALREHMTSTGAATRTRVSHRSLAGIRIGSDLVSLRVELIAGPSKLDRLDHGLAVWDTRVATVSETAQTSAETSRTAGWGSTQSVGTIDSAVIPRPGDLTALRAGLSGSIGTGDQLSSSRSRTRQRVEVFIASEPHAEYLTAYELRLTLDRGDGRPLTSQGSIGLLREQMPLSLTVPDARSAAEGDPLGTPTLDTPPRSVRLRAPGDVSAQDIDAWRSVTRPDGTRAPFEPPAQGFQVRRISGLENLRQAGELAIAVAYGTRVDAAPDRARELTGRALSAALDKARDSALTRPGTAAGLALDEAISDASLAPCFPESGTRDGYRVLGLNDHTSVNWAQGQYRLYSQPDFSRATLLTVFPDSAMITGEGDATGAGTALSHTSSRGVSATVQAVLSAGQAGSAVPALSLGTASGEDEARAVSAAQSAATSTERGGRHFLFAVPTAWLGIAEVRRWLAFGRVRPLPQGAHADTVLEVLVSEDVARDLGLVDERNLPPVVQDAWTQVTRAGDAWAAADSVYWQTRRGMAELRENAAEQDSGELLETLRRRAEDAAGEYHRVRAEADRLTRWHRLPAEAQRPGEPQTRAGLTEPPAVVFTEADSAPDTEHPVYVVQEGTPGEPAVLTSPESPQGRQSYTLYDVPFDGDGFYHALAEGLHHADPQGLGTRVDVTDRRETVRGLRRLLADELSHHDDLVEFTSPDTRDRFSNDELNASGAMPLSGPGRREFADSGHIPLHAELPEKQRVELAREQLLREGDADRDTGWDHGAADLLPALAARAFGVRVTVVGADGRFQDFLPLSSEAAEPAEGRLPHVVMQLKDRHYRPALPSADARRQPPLPTPAEAVRDRETPAGGPARPAYTTAPWAVGSGAWHTARVGETTRLIGPDGAARTLVEPTGDGTGFWSAVGAGLNRAEVTEGALVTGRPLPEGARLDRGTPFTDGELAQAGLSGETIRSARRQRADGTLPQDLELTGRQERALIRRQLLTSRGWSEATERVAVAQVAASCGVRVTVVGEDGTFGTIRPSDEAADPPELVLYRRGREYLLAEPLADGERATEPRNGVDPQPLGTGTEVLGSGQVHSDRWIPFGSRRSGVKVRYLLDRLGVGPGDGSVADLLGVGVGEVEGYRRGVRVPSAGVGVRIDVVWGLLREGRTGVTSADVDDVVEAGGAVSGPGAGVGVSGRVGGMSEVAPAVDYLAEGLDADELRFVSELLASDSDSESVVEPVGSDEVVSGLDADEWAGVWSALASDSDSESVVEPVTWDEVGADLGLDPDELEFVSEAVGEDPDVELSGGEGAGGLEEALSSEDASVVGASFVDEGGSRGGFVAGGGRGEADADVVAARGAKRRRLDGGGRPVVEAAAAVQAAGPVRSLLQLKLERVRDALGSVDGVDPVERLAGVVQIPADRVRGMVGGSVEQTSVTGEHRERIDAAFGLLNEGAALTAEAVDERVRARWTPLQATMVYLMEQAGVPGRTAEGVRLSDLLQGRRAAVYEFRWGTITPTMKVGDRINALKRLFEAGEDGLTPARVDAEVTRYRDEQEVDFAGKLAYLRGKLGGTRALVGAIKASDATLNISDKSVPSYVDPDYDANPPMDVSERVDELYALYRELDDVAEMAGLPTGGTLSPVQVKTGCLRESLGEGELPRLLKVSPQEVSSILSGRVKTPDTKVIECVDAAYGLLEEGVAVTTEAVDERVRARWTPIQKTMVSLLDGVGGARPLSDLLGVDISSVRYMRAGFQQPHKKIGDRIRALERLLSARAGGPLPTRADVDAAVAAAPAYDLTARVRYLSQVTGNINAVVRELNVGRAVGEPKVAWSTLKSYLQGSGADPMMEFADRIDRACHDFWRLGFRPVDAELAGVLRGEVAAAMAARSVAGSARGPVGGSAGGPVGEFVGGGDGTLARLAGGGRLAGERTQVGYAWRWFRDGAGQEVVRLTRRVYVAGAVVERVEAMRGRVSGVLEGLNGQGHRLPEGAGAASGSRLELGVEFVGSPEEADTVVELREGLPGRESGTMRQDVWFTGVDATAYAHELVHGFGVRDDVADPQVLLTPGGRGEQATAQGASSLMDTHVHGAGQSFVLTSDHLRQIAEGLAPYFHAGAGGSRGQVVRGAVGERPGHGGGMRDAMDAVDYRTADAGAATEPTAARASEPGPHADAESVVEPVTWDAVGADLDLDPDELEFVSEAVGEDPDVESGVELSGGEGAGGLEEALSSEDASVVGASFVDEGGSGGGFVAGGGRGRADADVVGAPGAKRRRGNGGRPVVVEAAAGQAGGGVAAGAGAAQDGGPARSLLQLKLERVRDALGSVDGVDPVERLAEVVQIPVDRVRGMVGGSVKQTGVTGEHRERIDAAFGLLNEGAALTAEAVDERVRARWTPLQATMVYLMEQAGVPGRTAEGAGLSDLLQGRRQGTAVYRYRLGTMAPTMKVGERINALKRLFEAGEYGVTPARVDAEVTRYRDEQEVDFAGKLAYLRGKLGGTRALVGAIKASDATLNISDKSVPRYVDPDYDANPPMDVSERVDELYALYRELDDVAEMAGLPTGETLSPVQVKVVRLRESLGEGELPRLLTVSPQEVSFILRVGVRAPDAKVMERIDAAYGLLEEGAAVTAEAVDERVRARWTPIQKTMVSLLDGVGGSRPLSDLLGVDISSVRYMRAGVQQPHKKIGDRIRALERLLSARVGGPLPTRADVDAAVAAAPTYDLTARVRYLVQVAGTFDSVAGELNAGRAVGEPKAALTTLKSYLQGRNADPMMEFADRIDRACHDFWRLGFRPVDAELAGVLRGEVAAATAPRSVAGAVGRGVGSAGGDTASSGAEGDGGQPGDVVMTDPAESTGYGGADAVAGEEGQEEEFTPDEMVALMGEFTVDSPAGASSLTGAEDVPGDQDRHARIDELLCSEAVLGTRVRHHHVEGLPYARSAAVTWALDEDAELRLGELELTAADRANLLLRSPDLFPEAVRWSFTRLTAPERGGPLPAE
nr:hypothetical protein OG409_36935 [Streptomyces sp. NBC_00974]